MTTKTAEARKELSPKELLEEELLQTYVLVRLKLSDLSLLDENNEYLGRIEFNVKGRPSRLDRAYLESKLKLSRRKDESGKEYRLRVLSSYDLAMGKELERIRGAPISFKRSIFSLRELEARVGLV